MRHCTKNSWLWILFLLPAVFRAQEKPQDTVDYIHILYADHATTSDKYPGKQLLSGDVKIEHNGALLFCDKAIVDKLENTAIAAGNVRLEQGDTLTMQAGFLKYDGQKSFAEAYDRVILTDPKMNLQTDTLYFDRLKQEAFYTSGGVIRDSVNTLTSKKGKYMATEKRFRFTHNVHIDNPDYKIDSYQLDYYTDTGISDFFGPTKIYNDRSYIYAEKGHYDSQNKVSWFVKNAFIKHKNTTIKGDSLYYDRKREYATGNRNVVVYDSINKTWIFSDYVQRWVNLDSVRVTQKPLVVSVSDKDTLFVRATDFVVAGKPNQRRLWGYDKVRFYSKDFSGRADSLYRSDADKTMRLMKNPVVWSDRSQITGNKIIVKNDSLNRLDSLIIPKDVFIIQRDSAGYNQIKGNKLLGKFEKDALKKIDIYGNTEVIYYLREDNGTLTGVEKDKCSHIFVEFDKGEVERIIQYQQPEGIIYPLEDFNKLNEQTFKGFRWRGDERIRSKDDIIGEKKPVYEAETRQKPTVLPEEEQEELLKQPPKN